MWLSTTSAGRWPSPKLELGRMRAQDVVSVAACRSVSSQPIRAGRHRHCGRQMGNLAICCHAVHWFDCERRLVLHEVLKVVTTSEGSLSRFSRSGTITAAEWLVVTFFEYFIFGFKLLEEVCLSGFHKLTRKNLSMSVDCSKNRWVKQSKYDRPTHCCLYFTIASRTM